MGLKTGDLLAVTWRIMEDCSVHGLGELLSFAFLHRIVSIRNITLSQRSKELEPDPQPPAPPMPGRAVCTLACACLQDHVVGKKLLHPAAARSHLLARVPWARNAVRGTSTRAVCSSLAFLLLCGKKLFVGHRSGTQDIGSLSRRGMRQLQGL